MKDKISKQHQYQHPIQKVWEAISQEEKISQWFIQANFKAEVGFEYTFIHEQTKIRGKVLKANPVFELVYTWIVSGTGVETTVSWVLEENTEGTLLTLEHSGLSQYPGETAVVMFENFDGGWTSCLNNLQTYLSTANHDQ